MASSGKRRYVDAEWVDVLVSQIPADCVQKTETLRSLVEEWSREKEFIKYPSISLSDP